jgi:hypothetical protein
MKKWNLLRTKIKVDKEMIKGKKIKEFHKFYKTKVKVMVKISIINTQAWKFKGLS